MTGGVVEADGERARAPARVGMCPRCRRGGGGGCAQVFGGLGGGGWGGGGGSWFGRGVRGTRRGEGERARLVGALVTVCAYVGADVDGW